MKARLLRTLIGERVSSDETGPGAGWTAGSCRHCDEKVWLSNAWAELLAGDPMAVATCFECAHALVEDPGQPPLVPHLVAPAPQAADCRGGHLQ